MKKILVSFFLFFSMVMANFKGEIKIGIEENREGLFLQNSFKREFLNDVIERKISPFKINLSYSDNIGVEFAINKNKSNKIRIDTYNYNLGLNLKTPEFKKVRFGYGFKYNIGDDVYHKVRDNNILHKISLEYDNKLKTNFNIEKIENEILSKELGIEYILKDLGITLVYKHKKTEDETRHLIDMKNKQSKISSEDDGHNHGGHLNELSKLEFSIRHAESEYGGKYKFRNNSNYFSINKKLNILNNKIDFIASYRKSNLHSNLANKIVSKITGKNLVLDALLKREIIKNFDFNIGTKFTYLNLNQDIFVKENNRGRKNFELELLGSNVYKGINEIEGTLKTTLTYFYPLNKKFNLLLGMDNNFTLNARYQDVYEQAYNNRKNAYEGEKQRIKNMLENQTEDDKKKREEELKKLKENIDKKQKEIDDYKKKKNFTSEIENALEKQKSRRDDLEDRKKEIKDEIKEKTYDKIEEYFKEKLEELAKLEKENNISSKNYSSFLMVSREKTREKRKEKIKEISDKLNINDKEKFAEKYEKLLEYRGNGLYASVKSKILIDLTKLNNKKNMEERKYNEKYNEFNVDENVKKALDILDESKKLTFAFKYINRSYVALRYEMIDNLYLNTSFSTTLELNKKLKKGSKLKHHIHLNPKIELRYVF
ncbi:hypothetical protein [Streptobacillus moniliformis]|uniref:hypothetical protein n=1 Tax=Streptobacillus moniliformis TaxID=34105 RepID=UPI0007E424DA|nr:hypothetical protein [Streptobacillus moniliformis]